MPDVGECSEDCLFVNVWTPAVDRAKRPVMVWIHGGAFVSGSSSQALYDGASLARRSEQSETGHWAIVPAGSVSLWPGTSPEPA